MSDLISRQDAIEAIESRQTEQWIESDIDYNSGLESALCEIKALPSAEAVQGECRTCKRSSDYLWKNGENGTRCPIEEHYALPKDGYCHLHEPYKGGDDE